MSSSLREIQNVIEQHDLVSRTAFEALIKRQRRELEDADSKRIAEQLVKADLLTRWQAKFVVQGKAELLTLGSYVLLDRLGSGGMGVVFKARHRTMDRIVAIKTLHPEIARRKETIARFYREVKAAAKLVDRNIVTAYDAGQERDIHFLVMEYVTGRDLSAIVREMGPIAWRQAAELVLQAASGLQHAHRQGLVHRDIKPSNLLLDRDGTVKVLDLGLARLVSLDADQQEAAGEDVTRAGQIMGTMDFMAPEQAEDMSTVDGRADIYSLGCTLYFLINGRSMYPGRTVLNKMLAHRQQPIPPLTEKDTTIPPMLETIFRRMVAKDPDDRFASMQDVVGTLESALQKLSTPEVGSGTTPSIAAQKLVAAVEQTRAEIPAYSELSELKGGATGSSLDLGGSSEMSLPWAEDRKWHQRIGVAQWAMLAAAAIIVAGAIVLVKPPVRKPEFTRAASDNVPQKREPRVFHASSAKLESADAPPSEAAADQPAQTHPAEKVPQAENSFSL
ncbi:protein kinase [bacterium]|nr:protein kinase [bacterium]